MHKITDHGWALKCSCGIIFTGDAEKGAKRHLAKMSAGEEDLSTALKGWANEEFTRTG